MQVEELLQASRALHAEDKINVEIAVLKEAFARLQVCTSTCMQASHVAQHGM